MSAGRVLTWASTAKKASTLRADKGRIENHIKRRLGKLKVAAVTRADIDRFMHDIAAGATASRAKTGKPRGLSHVRGGNGAASRTTGLLGAIFNYAVAKGMRTENPARGVRRFKDGERTRRLSDDEYLALKASEAALMWPAGVAAARFLAITGWRQSAQPMLRWRREVGRVGTGISDRDLSP